MRFRSTALALPLVFAGMPAFAINSPEDAALFLCEAYNMGTPAQCQCAAELWGGAANDGDAKYAIVYASAFEQTRDQARANQIVTQELGLAANTALTQTPSLLGTLQQVAQRCS